jgi:LPXTG-site transpeptidase (sortase) family protein
MNFLFSSNKTENSSESKTSLIKALLRLGAVFLVAFLVISLIMNLGNFLGLTKDKISSKTNEDENNIKMTQMYRNLYGYGSGYPDNGFDNGGLGGNNSAVAMDNESGKIAGAINEVTQSQNGGSAKNIVANYIYIPKLGIKAPLVASTTTEQSALLTDLKKGVIIYPGSTGFGDGLNSVIIGHSSSNTLSNPYGRIFSGLGRLLAGDQVFVNYQGKDYIYTVKSKKTGSVQELAGQVINDDLLLATCWPIGTDKERIVVSAEAN